MFEASVTESTGLGFDADGYLFPTDHQFTLYVSATEIDEAGQPLGLALRAVPTSNDTEMLSKCDRGDTRGRRVEYHLDSSAPVQARRPVGN